MGLARMYRGTAHYVGFVIESFLLFYNRRLFEAAGLSAPPATLDEFADHAQRLTDRDRDRFGCYVEGGDGWSFQQWTTWALGTGGVGVNRTFFDASGRCVLNSPRHAAGLHRSAPVDSAVRGNVKNAKRGHQVPDPEIGGGPTGSEMGK